MFNRQVGLCEWFRQRHPLSVAVVIVVLAVYIIANGIPELALFIIIVLAIGLTIGLIVGSRPVPRPPPPSPVEVQTISISPKQRVDVAMRALAGEDKSTLAQELGVSPGRVAEWAQVFKERGQSGVEGPAAPPLFDASKWLSVLGPIVILTGLGVHIAYYYYYWDFYRQLGLSPEEAGISYPDVLGRESVAIARMTFSIISAALVVAISVWGFAKFAPLTFRTRVREGPWRIIMLLGCAALLFFAGSPVIKKLDQLRNQSKTKQLEDITIGHITSLYNDAIVNLPIDHVVLIGPRSTGPPAEHLMIRLGQANGITPILDPATGVLWRVPTATTPMVSSRSAFEVDLGDPTANNTHPTINNIRLDITDDGTPFLDSGENKRWQLTEVRTSETCLVKGFFFGDEDRKDLLEAYLREDSTRENSTPEIEEIRRKARRKLKIVVFPIGDDVNAPTVNAWVFWASGGPALNVTLVQKGLASNVAGAQTPYGKVPATQKRLSC